MVRQLYVVFALVTCSTYGLEGAAQGLADGATAVDVVERIQPTTVVGGDGNPRRVFSVKILCGRVDPTAQVIVGGGPGVQVGVGDGIGIGVGDGGGGFGAIIGQPQPQPAAGIVGPGAVFDPLELDEVLTPGVYRTVVTAFNPGGPGDLGLSIDVVLTLPVRVNGFDATDGIDGITRTLPPRRGIEIDCVDILNLLSDPFGFDGAFLDTGFVTGLLVLEGPDRALDVSAVYTARSADG